MKERDVVKKIRNYLMKTYGATCHKHFGSPLSERGHADLYGTLPGGQAYYLEVKSPTAKPDKRREGVQAVFMATEAGCGAIAGFVRSVEDVDLLLNVIFPCDQKR